MAADEFENTGAWDHAKDSRAAEGFAHTALADISPARIRRIRRKGAVVWSFFCLAQIPGLVSIGREFISCDGITPFIGLYLAGMLAMLQPTLKANRLVLIVLLFAFIADFFTVFRPGGCFFYTYLDSSGFPTFFFFFLTCGILYAYKSSVYHSAPPAEIYHYGCWWQSPQEAATRDYRLPTLSRQSVGWAIGVVAMGLLLLGWLGKYEPDLRHLIHHR